jgi:hypothetical protein
MDFTEKINQRIFSHFSFQKLEVDKMCDHKIPHSPARGSPAARRRTSELGWRLSLFFPTSAERAELMPASDSVVIDRKPPSDLSRVHARLLTLHQNSLRNRPEIDGNKLLFRDL